MSKPSYEALISGYSFLVLERVIISMDIEPLLTESVIGTNNYLRKAGGSQLLLCERGDCWSFDEENIQLLVQQVGGHHNKAELY